MGAGRKPAMVRLAGRGHDRSILHPYRGTRPSEHQLAAFLSRTTRYFAVSTFCFSTPLSVVKSITFWKSFLSWDDSWSIISMRGSGMVMTRSAGVQVLHFRSEDSGVGKEGVRTG